METTKQRKSNVLRVAVIAILVFLWIAVVVILGKWISGGKATERKVAAVLQTNEFMVRAFQGSITKIKASDGPSQVNFQTYPAERHGLRSGFYSFLVKGAKTNGEFKVEWSETPARAVQILRISQCAPWQQDKLVWERPLADTKNDKQ